MLQKEQEQAVQQQKQRELEEIESKKITCEKQQALVRINTTKSSFKSQTKSIQQVQEDVSQKSMGPASTQNQSLTHSAYSRLVRNQAGEFVQGAIQLASTKNDDLTEEESLKAQIENYRRTSILAKTDLKEESLSHSTQSKLNRNLAGNFISGAIQLASTNNDNQEEEENLKAQLDNYRKTSIKAKIDRQELERMLKKHQEAIKTQHSQMSDRLSQISSQGEFKIKNQKKELEEKRDSTQNKITSSLVEDNIFNKNSLEDKSVKPIQNQTDLAQDEHFKMNKNYNSIPIQTSQRHSVDVLNLADQPLKQSEDQLQTELSNQSQLPMQIKMNSSPPHLLNQETIRIPQREDASPKALSHQQAQPPEPYVTQLITLAIPALSFANTQHHIQEESEEEFKSQGEQARRHTMPPQMMQEAMPYVTSVLRNNQQEQEQQIREENDEQAAEQSAKRSEEQAEKQPTEEHQTEEHQTEEGQSQHEQSKHQSSQQELSLKESYHKESSQHEQSQHTSSQHEQSQKDLSQQVINETAIENQSQHEVQQNEIQNKRSESVKSLSNHSTPSIKTTEKEQQDIISYVKAESNPPQSIQTTSIKSVDPKYVVNLVDSDKAFSEDEDSPTKSPPDLSKQPTITEPLLSSPLKMGRPNLRLSRIKTKDPQIPLAQINYQRTEVGEQDEEGEYTPSKKGGKGAKHYTEVQTPYVKDRILKDESDISSNFSKTQSMVKQSGAMFRSAQENVKKEETKKQIKQEEVNKEEIKQEEIKQEEIKQEEIKIEEVKIEEVKIEEVKIEEVKIEANSVQIQAQETQMDKQITKIEGLEPQIAQQYSFKDRAPSIRYKNTQINKQETEVSVASRKKMSVIPEERVTDLKLIKIESKEQSPVAFPEPPPTVTKIEKQESKQDDSSLHSDPSDQIKQNSVPPVQEEDTLHSNTVLKTVSLDILQEELKDNLNEQSSHSKTAKMQEESQELSQVGTRRHPNQIEDELRNTGSIQEDILMKVSREELSVERFQERLITEKTLHNVSNQEDVEDKLASGRNTVGTPHSQSQQIDMASQNVFQIDHQLVQEQQELQLQLAEHASDEIENEIIEQIVKQQLDELISADLAQSLPPPDSTSQSKHLSFKAVDLAEDRLLSVLLQRHTDLAISQLLTDSLCQSATDKALDLQIADLLQMETCGLQEEAEQRIAQKAVFLASCYTANGEIQGASREVDKEVEEGVLRRVMGGVEERVFEEILRGFLEEQEQQMQRERAGQREQQKKVEYKEPDLQEQHLSKETSVEDNQLYQNQQKNIQTPAFKSQQTAQWHSVVRKIDKSKIKVKDQNGFSNLNQSAKVSPRQDAHYTSVQDLESTSDQQHGFKYEQQFMPKQQYQKPRTRTQQRQRNTSSNSQFNSTIQSVQFQNPYTMSQSKVTQLPRLDEEKMIDSMFQKKINNSGSRSPLNNKSIAQVKLEDLLDIKTFEKNYLGRESTQKDQLYFRIYARDMLDMIKKNLDRQIQSKAMSIKKQIRRARSRSPQPELKLQTPMPQERQDWLKMQQDQRSGNIVNIQIRDKMNMQPLFSKSEHEQRIRHLEQQKGFESAAESSYAYPIAYKSKPKRKSPSREPGYQSAQTVTHAPAARPLQSAPASPRPSKSSYMQQMAPTPLPLLPSPKGKPRAASTTRTHPRTARMPLQPDYQMQDKLNFIQSYMQQTHGQFGPGFQANQRRLKQVSPKRDPRKVKSKQRPVQNNYLT